MAGKKFRDRTTEVLVATTEADGYSLLLQFKGQGDRKYPEHDQLVIENCLAIGPGTSLYFDVIEEYGRLSLRPHNWYADLNALQVALALIDRKRNSLIEALTK